MPTIEQQLVDLIDVQKTFMGRIQKDFRDLRSQVDAFDAGSQRRIFTDGDSHKTIADSILEHADFKQWKSGGFLGKGIRIPLVGQSAFGSEIERKSTILTSDLGSGTAGVLPHLRLPNVVGIAEQSLRLRGIMTVLPQTEGSTFEWIRQTTRTNAPSPQTEGSTKGESTYAWDAQSGTIRTIAHWVNFSRQALDDAPWFRRVISSELLYGLLLKEETEILSGDGLGVHLNGLITQATAYSTAYNQTGDTKLDKLRHAKLQARLAGLATYPPDAFVLHPTDLHTIELIKEQASNVGSYISADPKTGQTTKMIWGLPVVESDSISAGTFLVGAFNTASVLIDRMAPVVDLSFEHDQNFTKNMVTARCESRVGLAVTKPGAFIYGSY